MFERFSERARRVIFFARYDAGSLGSTIIDTEHLLLGLLREDKQLKARFPPTAIERIRREITERAPKNAQVSTSIDLPVSKECERLLNAAAEESASLQHKSIDSTHLVLAALQVEHCVAGQILRRHGIEYEQYRESVRNLKLSHADREMVSEASRATISFPREAQSSESFEPGALPMEGSPLLPYALRLGALVDRASRHLEAQSDLDGELRLKRAPWTRQEALGHLVDWATCHHQWFARALSEPKLVATRYPSSEWVTAQAYLQYQWGELVRLWTSMNRILVHVLARVPEQKLATPCRIGIDAPLPLSQLVENYVEHCEDLMSQILTRGLRSNPAPD